MFYLRLGERQENTTRKILNKPQDWITQNGFNHPKFDANASQIWY
jgi:hypothetical protein